MPDIYALVRTMVAATLVAAPIAAFSQDTTEPSFALDLNSAAETEAGACRLTLVAANRTGAVLSDVSYEVAVFDGAGTVTQILILEFGALTNGKTRILQFDIAGQTCADTSRIVVNDVAACTLADDGGVGDFCLSALDVSSRTPIQFGL